MAATSTIRNELLDELLEGRDPKGLFEKDGLLDDLKKALAERMLNAEMDQHASFASWEAGSRRHSPARMNRPSRPLRIILRRI